MDDTSPTPLLRIDASESTDDVEIVVYSNDSSNTPQYAYSCIYHYSDEYSCDYPDFVPSSNKVSVTIVNVDESKAATITSQTSIQGR